MARYAIYIFCHECSDEHPMGVTVDLSDGPPSRESLSKTYAGKELPPEVAALITNMVTCPQTQRLTSQQDHDQVFLVPVG
jgi:hypothetical protein